MSVVQLTNKGFSPQMNNACDAFAESIESAVDEAAEKDVPLEFVIGSMVCTILSMFSRSEAEQ